MLRHSRSPSPPSLTTASKRMKPDPTTSPHSQPDLALMVQNTLVSLNQPEQVAYITFLTDLLRLLQHNQFTASMQTQLQQLVLNQCRWLTYQSDPSMSEWEAREAMLYHGEARRLILESCAEQQQQEVKSSCDWSRLPDSLFLKILLPLDRLSLFRASRVSRQWFEFIQQSRVLCKLPRPLQVELNLYEGRYHFDCCAPLKENHLTLRSPGAETVPEDETVPIAETPLMNLFTVAEMDQHGLPVVLVGASYLCWIEATDLTRVRVASLPHNDHPRQHTIVFDLVHSHPIHQFVRTSSLSLLSSTGTDYTRQHHLATASDDGRVRFWHFPTGRCTAVLNLESPVLNMDCDTAGHLMCLTANGRLSLWRDQALVMQRQILPQEVFATPLGQLEQLNPIRQLEDMCLAVNSLYCVVGEARGQFLVYNHRGHFIQRLRDPLFFDADSTTETSTFAQWLHESLLLTSGRRRNDMCVWDVHSGRLLYRLSASKQGSLQFVEYRNGVLMCSMTSVDVEAESEEKQRLVVFDFNVRQQSSRYWQQDVYFGPGGCILVHHEYKGGT